jgi:hypothetical protein
MPCSYADFRKVLHNAGFLLLRSKKHETWQKVLPDGTILLVRVSHQHGRDIPPALFHRMLRQANLTHDEFVRALLRLAQPPSVVLGAAERIGVVLEHDHARERVEGIDADDGAFDEAGRTGKRTHHVIFILK